MAQHHDTGYKQLYSFPEMVEDLVTGFIHADWVQQLDFSTLEKLNSSYVTDDFRSRSDDVIWRVKFQDQWLYLYLLLEFQSTVDHFMPVRILSYVSLLYQDLQKSDQLPDNKKLPPVLPIVLYNGQRAWNAATSIAELLPPMPESLQLFQPQQRFWLIDEGRYSVNELEQLENLTAAVMRAELAEDEKQFAKVVANLNIWLQRPDQNNLRRIIKEWLISLLQNHLPDAQVNELRDLTEIETMLARSWSEKWLEQGRNEGIEKGIEQGRNEGIEKGIEQGRNEGIEKGEAKGEVTVLKKLLTKRFGELPDWATQKLEQANLPQLEAWTEKLFDSETLTDFFEA